MSVLTPVAYPILPSFSEPPSTLYISTSSSASSSTDFSTSDIVRRGLPSNIPPPRNSWRKLKGLVTAKLLFGPKRRRSKGSQEFFRLNLESLPQESVVVPPVAHPQICSVDTRRPTLESSHFYKLSSGWDLRSVRLDYASHCFSWAHLGRSRKVLPFEDILGVRVGEEVDWILTELDEETVASPYRLCIFYLEQARPRNLCLAVDDIVTLHVWYNALVEIIRNRSDLDTAELYRLHALVWTQRAATGTAGRGTQILPSLSSATFESGIPELWPVFEHYSTLVDANNSTRYMPIDHFHKFLTSAQQEEITLEAAHARLTHFAGRPWLFFPEFSAYVTSFVNAMRNPVAVAPVDASLPLSQYFIKSSHNTYLTGNQFSSKSSIDAYILPLLAGCRSVEIDVLDYKNEPYVYHGYTFTSRIPFKLVLQVIRKYAFVTSDFPLTLSLETHCKAPQQIKMAQYMRDVLGELLVTESLDAEVMDLPSPEQLSRRILIKNKAAAAHDPNSTRPLPDAERHHSAQSSSDGTNSSMPEAKGGPSSSILSKKVKFVSDLAQLNVYHQGSRLPKLPRSSDSPDLGPFQPHFDQIFSLPENKLASYQNDFDRLVRITSTNIIRTFPKYTRVFSGNYNPLSFWAVGSQMVALNYQSFDFHTQMNQALFHPGNRAGYLLKPDHLRYPTEPDRWDGPPTTTLSIRVLAVMHLPEFYDRSQDPELLVEHVAPNPETLAQLTNLAGTSDQVYEKLERIHGHDVRLHLTSSSSSRPSNTDNWVTPMSNHPITPDDLPRSTGPATTTSARRPSPRGRGSSGSNSRLSSSDPTMLDDMRVGGTPLQFIRFIVRDKDEVLASATLRADTFECGYRVVPLETFVEGGSKSASVLIEVKCPVYSDHPPVIPKLVLQSPMEIPPIPID